MAKKAINWTEIEVRYKAGDKPSHLARDYKNLTPRMISNKANKDGWREAKERIRENVVSAIEGEMTKRLSESASLAVSLEQELIETQLMIVRRGKEFLQCVEKAIQAYARTEEEDPAVQMLLVDELKSQYKYLVGRYIPSNVVTAAYKCARAEAELIAEAEGWEDENKQPDALKFELNINRQSEAGDDEA